MKVSFNKLTAVVLMISALLVAFSFFYHYVLLLPQRQKADEQMLDACLEEADRKWQKSAQQLTQLMQGGYRISAENIDELKKEANDTLRADRDKCFKRYPQN